MIYIIIITFNIVSVLLLFIKLNILIINIEKLDCKISMRDDKLIKNFSRTNSNNSNNSNYSNNCVSSNLMKNISQSYDILYKKNKNISSGTLFDLNKIKKNRKIESNII